MEHPTGEEIWGPGDWWQRRNEKKVTKHLERRHYQTATQEKIYKVEIVTTVNPLPWYGYLLHPLPIYILGVLITKVVWGSWLAGLCWPILAPFKIYFYFYPITWSSLLFG